MCIGLHFGMQSLETRVPQVMGTLPQEIRICGMVGATGHLLLVRNPYHVCIGQFARLIIQFGCFDWW